MKAKYRCRIHENNDEWETIESYGGKTGAAENFAYYHDEGDFGESVDIEVKEVGRGKKPEVIRVNIRTQYSA